MKEKKNNYKIVWLHPHFLNWMGGHRYIYEVTKRLVRHYGMGVILYSGAMSDYAKNKFNKSGISVKTFLGFSTNNPIYWLLMPLFLFLERIYFEKEAKSSHVVISSMFPMNIIANLLTKKTIQLCYEPFAFFHDNNFIESLPFFRKIFIKIIRPIYLKSEIDSTARSRKILTISNFNKRWIKKVYNKNEVDVVYEGVDTNFFKPVTKNLLNVRYNNRRIIFHSTDFTGIKGTSYLIEAVPHIVKKIPKLLLLISYTINNEKERENIIRRARDLGISKNIKFLGFVKYEDLPLYYNLSEVVIQPSISQSMSMSVKEAMACKTPVITCTEGKEQYRDGQAGFLVNPKNGVELAEKVLKLLGDNKLRRKMGEEGRRIILNKFSWDSVANKFYRNIVELY